MLHYFATRLHLSQSILFNTELEVKIIAKNIKCCEARPFLVCFYFHIETLSCPLMPQLVLA